MRPVRRIHVIILLLAACCGADRSFAQGDAELRPGKDLEMWLSAGIEMRPFTDKSRIAQTPFAKRFRTALEAGYRSNENLGNGKNVYATLGLRYKVADGLKLGLDTRYNIRDRASKNSFRIDFGPSYSRSFGKFGLGYRLTFQHEFIPLYRVRDYLRNRISVGYRIKNFRMDPYVSVETFTAFHYSGNYFAGIRYDLGAHINLKGDHGLDVVLRHDREIGVAEPLYRTIIVLAYEFNWKR